MDNILLSKCWVFIINCCISEAHLLLLLQTCTCYCKLLYCCNFVPTIENYHCLVSYEVLIACLYLEINHIYDISVLVPGRYSNNSLPHPFHRPRLFIRWSREGVVGLPKKLATLIPWDHQGSIPCGGPPPSLKWWDLLLKKQW